MAEAKGSTRKASVSDRVAGTAGGALPKGKATRRQVQTLAGEVERQRQNLKVPRKKS